MDQESRSMELRSQFPYTWQMTKEQMEEDFTLAEQELAEGKRLTHTAQGMLEELAERLNRELPAIQDNQRPIWPSEILAQHKPEQPDQ